MNRTPAPAPEYAHSYELKFTETHMVIRWSSPGKSGSLVFELHRTRPAGVRWGVQSVRTKSGRIMEFGGIRNGEDVDWVCWPYGS